MKKIIIWIFIIFCIQILTAETILQTYNFEIPEIISKDGYTELNYLNCHNFGVEGEPYLPYYSANILLPQNQEIDKIVIISSEHYPAQEGITIKPAARQFPISSGKHLDYKVIPNEDIYTSSKSFPEKVVDNSGTNFLCGHSIAAFTICPVSYVPSESQVEFLKSITIEIMTSNTSKAHSAERFLRNSQQIENRIQKIVENPEILNQYTYSQQSREEEEDILIITNSTLLPSFTDYIDFKESTGFIVETVTTEYIDVTYTGADIQEKIRNCIIDHYANNGISYVILGGDSDTNNPSEIIVPHRGLSALDDSEIPSDMYYAGLDGNWNTDADALWGEQNEWDLYAEVSIGRLSVDSATEISNFTHKLKMYQDSPVVLDIEKTLMLGEELNDAPQTNGGTYKNEIVSGGSFNGYTTTGIPGNITVSTLYQMDLSYTKTDIYNHFNTTGLNLMNHLGHSNVTYNMLMYNSDITTSNFTNDGISRGYVIGYSQGCYNGSFDNRSTTTGSYYTEDSFAENITTLETAEVAAIANSRYGWYQPAGTNSSSQYYDRQFYDAIFGQNITSIGEANRYSKEEDVSRIQSDQYMCWTAYELNLFGDPSMDIWTDVPVAMNVSYPASISLGMNSIQFTTDAPYARIGLIQNGEIIGRAVAGVSGDVTVNLFAPIDDTNDITVSIIAHDMIRHQGTIAVVSNQAYIIYNSHIINDPTGNNNGNADYGESVTLDVTLENVGTHDALGVNAIISTTNSYVTLTDDTQSYGSITTGFTSAQSNAFAFSIDNDIPDQHIVDLNLEITGTSARETWNSTFQIIVNAPKIMISDMIIDDSAENNNGRLDPGETVDLIIPTNNNGHSNSPTAIGTLSCASGYITINGSNMHNFGVINASSTEDAVFSITVDSEAPIGNNASFEYNVSANSYGVDETFNRMIGLIVEDFEAGNFSSYPWEFGGNADWSVVTDSPQEGIYCTKSGDITDSQTSELILDVDVIADGIISFFVKVSSESNFDFLKFFIDDVQIGSWAGEVDWSEVSYPVTAGSRIFKWQYYKDSSVSNGSDCAWLDYIIFPAIYFPEPADIIVTPLSFEETLQLGGSTSDILTIGNAGEMILEYTATVSYVAADVILNNRNNGLNESIISTDKKTEIQNVFQSNVTQSNRNRDYATIGAGGSVSTSTNDTPFGTYYHDGQNQYLFTASELSTAGLIAGNINAVGWNIASAAAQTMNGFNIELKHTTTTSVTGFETGFTNCYSGTWTASAGWNDISFSTPFNWDGTSNLLVKVCFDNTSYTTNSSCYVDTYTAMNGWAYNDGTSGCTDPHEGTIDSRPQIRFDYTAAPTLNWLTLNGGYSVIGSIDSGSPDDVITVGFDTVPDGLTEGIYEANITITSNDPDQPTITVPVTLTVSQQLDVPQNVTISTTPNGADVDVLISWTAVPGATSYTVYRSASPYAGFPGEWTLETGIIGTTWSYTTDRAHRFYRVTANN